MGFGVLVSAIFEGRDGEGAKKKSHWVKPHLFKGRAPKKPKCHKGHNLGRFSTTKMLNQKKGLGQKRPKCREKQNRICSKISSAVQVPTPHRRHLQPSSWRCHSRCEGDTSGVNGDELRSSEQGPPICHELESSAKTLKAVRSMTLTWTFVDTRVPASLQICAAATSKGYPVTPQDPSLSARCERLPRL